MKIAIFHFSPLELYPPVMNFLGILAEKASPELRINVYSTKNTLKIDEFQLNNEFIKIYRIGINSLGLKPVKRYLQYIKYNVLSLLYLIQFSPRKILYYETLSSFAPSFYKLFKKNSDLYIHYHEYMSPEEYNKMWLNKIFHRLEKKVLIRAKWVSHTNPERMSLFLKDINFPNLQNAYVFPNYPPLSWLVTRKKFHNYPVRLVYVGSFGSMNSLYIKELLNWVKLLKGEVMLDIYSYATPPLIKTFIDSLNCPDIQLKGPLNYAALPSVLQSYDVGLIIYKCIEKNFVYNAPNKLFEYLACGLDVWFPFQMECVKPFLTFSTYPKVVPIDFEKLNTFDWKKALDKSNLEYKPSTYFAENATKCLLKEITGRT